MHRSSPLGLRLAAPLTAVLLGSATLAACSSVPASLSAKQTRVHGHVISDTMLSQVPVGASQDQVLLALGTPSTTSTLTEAGDVFYYISQKTEAAAAFMPHRVVDQRVVAVYFDKKKRVGQLANYGLKDGQVFDFVARKTPTGGREVSFLGQLLQGVATPSLGL